jgi:hypothetical protein
VIRPLHSDDVGDLASLWRDLRPDAVHSPLGLRHLVVSFPERAQVGHWVAEEDGIGYEPFVERTGYVKEL